MAEFLSAVSSFFSTVLNGLKQILMAPVYIVEMVASASNVISQILAYIPTELYVFAVAVVAVSVIYLILNR